MEEVQRSQFAAWLKHYRLAAELTQEELAQRAGLSARGISALERGVNERPRKQTVHLLARALGLSGEERERFEAAARRLPQRNVGGSRPEPAMAWRRIHAGPLAGRVQEMAVIERHLNGAGPPVLLFAGEPGMGKSRLLKEAGQLGRERGLTVLYGGCQQRKGQEPYSPLVMALARYAQRRSPAEVRAAIRDCDSLVRLLPEVADLVGAPPPAAISVPEQERRLLFAAVVRFMGNVAGPAGTLLLLDDLQWAGNDALELLAAIAIWAEEVPLRVVATYRHTELSPGTSLSVALPDLAQLDLARQVVLGALSNEESRELVTGLLQSDGEFSSEVLDRIVARAEGVPFFLVSSLQWLRAGGPEESVPWNVRESIRQRLRVVSTEAQRVLNVAAMAGRTVARSLLLSVSDQPEEGVVAALEELSRAGLLLENGEHAYRLAHDVVREVVGEGLGAAGRALLHRQIAETLEELGPKTRATELAWHLYQAGEPARALPYAVQAGNQAEEVFAHSEAERHYRMALELAQEPGALSVAGVRFEADVLGKLGDVLLTMARYDEALEILERAAGAYQELGDMPGLARTSLKVGQSHAGRGTPEEGAARIRALLRLLEETGSAAELASVYVALARIYFFSGRYDQQAITARRAVEEAASVDDARVRSEAWTLYGHARSLLGDMQEGSRALEHALELSEAKPDAAIETQPLILGALSMMRLVEGEFEAAGSFAQRAVEVSGRLGDPTAIALWRAALGLRAFFMGCWREARNNFEHGVMLNQGVGLHSMSPYPLFCLGWLHLAEGAVDSAIRVLDESVEIARRTGNLQALRWATGIRAELDLSEGRAEAALSRLLPLLDRPGLEEWDVDLLLPRVVWAYALLGDLGRAEFEATRSIERARSRRQRVPMIGTLRAHAWALRRRGRTADARTALDEAVLLTKTLPYPYAEAQVLCDLAALQSDAGRSSDAGRLLKDARSIFLRLGARKDGDRVERALRRGADPSIPPSEG